MPTNVVPTYHVAVYLVLDNTYLFWTPIKSPPLHCRQRER